MRLEVIAKIEDAEFSRKGLCGFGSVVKINPEEEDMARIVLLSNSPASFFNPGAATLMNGELRDSGSLNLNILAAGVSKTVLTPAEILLLLVGPTAPYHARTMEQEKINFVEFYLDLDADVTTRPV